MGQVGVAVGGNREWRQRSQAARTMDSRKCCSHTTFHGENGRGGVKAVDGAGRTQNLSGGARPGEFSRANTLKGRLAGSLEGTRARKEDLEMRGGGLSPVEGAAGEFRVAIEKGTVGMSRVLGLCSWATADGRIRQPSERFWADVPGRACCSRRVIVKGVMVGNGCRRSDELVRTAGESTRRRLRIRNGICGSEGSRYVSWGCGAHILLEATRRLAGTLT